ncbi:MFS transporter [Acinetobacter calcoaceticus]|uniref:MFS transporter n=1 Tax=Acinetobacter calcoaceticus TaxID=471 RepID=UPI0019013EFD|nr:MFS transporter [Acinetobacter calcoaceticus]MBJ9704710.1 MFS transporter [Acinetobacter calcoaceticus]
MPMDISLKNLVFLSSATFISSLGSILLQISLTFYFYETTKSALLTGILVSLQWLPALLVVFIRNNWESGSSPLLKWRFSELFSVAITFLLIFFIDKSIYWIVVLLFVRGMFDQIVRVNRTVACRYVFTSKNLQFYSSILQSSYHIGISVAAILAIVFIGKLNLNGIILVNIVTYFISIGLIGFSKILRDFPKTLSGESNNIFFGIKDYVSILKNNKFVRIYALLFPITAIFFQGTYTVLQTIYPLQKYHITANESSMSYVVAGIAIIAGSLTFTYISKKIDLYSNFSILIIIILSLLTVVSYTLCLMVDDKFLALILFMLMVFIFEILWMYGYIGSVKYSPDGKLSLIYGISFSIGCFGAGLMSMILGFLIDLINNQFLKLILISNIVYMAIILLLCQSKINIVKRLGVVNEKLD